jgi:Arc/MetJ family transcription regulator
MGLPLDDGGKEVDEPVDDEPVDGALPATPNSGGDNGLEVRKRHDTCDGGRRWVDARWEDDRGCDRGRR